MKISSNAYIMNCSLQCWDPTPKRPKTYANFHVSDNRRGQWKDTIEQRSPFKLTLLETLETGITR